MRFESTGIPGMHLIRLDRRSDERGYFARLWCAEELAANGLVSSVAQVNTGFSPRAGTLRGMHHQVAPHLEVKLARCVRGAVFDVAVDLRVDSPTYLQWRGYELREGDDQILYIPGGCAHGYQTLVDDSELVYFASVPYAPSAARGVRWDDPAFAIRWPREVSVISQADATWPALMPASLESRRLE